jgi:valyl-tRNA synthetase
MKLSKTYNPGLYESDIYALWEKSEAFTPDSSRKETYSIVVPPPNANGNLHIGHALTLALEDIAVRYQRSKGKAALLLPGADHAGFETQVVFEKELAKSGKSRFDFQRDELYKLIWDFVELNRGNFENQLRRLGAGVDWTRFTFTLDDKIVDRSYKTFKKMWDEGLIYRGERLVNYCTKHRTGFSDYEVEYAQAKTPLYYIKYGPFELATTRPETKFGDTAVAVHPDDERYKEWIGKTVNVEGVNGSFEVRVVADEMVDPNFGTGVVKITPAHSFDDWDVAQRHNLPAVRVINHDGTMNHKAGMFEGMTVLEAREAVAKAMEQKDLIVRIDNDYTTRVGACYKCDTVIEPMLLEQWFVSMEPLAKRAISSLKKDEITFYPNSKKTQLITYLEGLRDWNISRQIAWGIPIPAFQNVNDSDDWIYDERVNEEIIDVNGTLYRRDPDVFDTWFSSSSWPYATLNYPEEDFKRFYPLDVMETGGEILYPWVSRMIMLGLYVTDRVPFKSVYIHGYVMAEDGAKMSKSVGNVIDPSEVIDEYGSDALRMGIISGRTPAVNRGYDRRRVEEARNFCNKLWNIARFVEDKLDANAEIGKPEPMSDVDHWMLSKLQHTRESVSSYLDALKFAEAYDTIYHFVWDDLADWYIESSKASLNVALLRSILKDVLVIVHPFAPFLTEAIWQSMHDDESLVATANWPDARKFSQESADKFDNLISLVKEIRLITAAVQVKRPSLYFVSEPYLESNAELIKRLASLGKCQAVSSGKGMKLTRSTFTAWLDIDSESAKRYTDRLSADQLAIQSSITLLESRVANESYIKKAPKELVQQTKKQLEEERARLSSLTSELQTFRSSMN